MWTRRSFLNKTTAAGAALMVPGWVSSSSLLAGEVSRLVILHTNDVHSRIEPFPDDGSRNAGLGGAARRAQIIKQIRSGNENVLLLDSGDIFQGTPYFNFFLGELEMKLMSAMGYDATTIGNHDFDGGLDNLEKQLREHADFPMVVSNYDFSDTVMHDRHSKRIIIQKGDIRIGIVGVGIALDGLVPPSLYAQTRYLDPIAQATRQANILKHDEKCDLVICLSHLGYKYNSAKVDDHKLAQNSTSIDIILGGHTHTFMDEPDYLINKEGKNVIVHQVGWAGIRLGKIDIAFEKNKPGKCVSCEGIWVK
jgi:5'-nucleotidase